MIHDGHVSAWRRFAGHTDWQQEGLRLPSIVRTEKLATVEKSAVIRVFGHLSVRDWNAVEVSLATVFREIVPL